MVLTHLESRKSEILPPNAIYPIMKFRGLYGICSVSLSKSCDGDALNESIRYWCTNYCDIDRSWTVNSYLLL